VLKAFRVTTSPDLCTPLTVQVFYSDEHALTLGIRQIQVKKSCGSTTGTTTTNYPFTPMASPGPTAQSADHPQVGSTFNDGGDQDGTDTSDRPMFPALFITDETYNPPFPQNLAGDWQYGGKAIPPHFVSGTWKGAVRIVDHTTNPATITVTPDADPTGNHWNLGPGADAVPPGLLDEGYGAEVRWNIAELGLLPGHTYRLYFIVHDGDQNHTGGDSGQGCAYITMPGGPAASPTPTATASPTPTATPTATPGVVLATSKTFSGKTFTVTFENDTAVSQLLTRLQMTWPQATNGNLTKIVMNVGTNTTIYNTPTGNGMLDTMTFLGTAAARTIPPGSCGTLQFTFANNVSTNNASYTGTATFSPFGPVTYLP
jgi:hypothetical protein